MPALHGANGQANEEAITAITTRYTRLPFRDMHWPAWLTRLYEGDDVVIKTNGDAWIWVTARSRRALDHVDALVREAKMSGWELYDGE